MIFTRILLYSKAMDSIGLLIILILLIATLVYVSVRELLCPIRVLEYNRKSTPNPNK